MKKMLSFLLSVLMIAASAASLLSMNVSASGKDPRPSDIVISASSADIDPGTTTITIAIAISGVVEADRVGSIEITVEIDTTKLKYKSSSRKAASRIFDSYTSPPPATQVPFPNPIKIPAYTIDFDTVSNEVADGINDDFVHITYDVLPGWTGNTTVTVGTNRILRLGTSDTDPTDGAPINVKAEGGYVNGVVHVHNYVWTAVAAKPATCVAVGEEIQTCSCGLTTGEERDAALDPNNHKDQVTGAAYGTHEVTVDPVTCHSDRTYTSNCDGCNALISGPDYDTTTQRLPHNFGNWVVDTVPTCSAFGTRYRVCQNTGCGDEDTQTNVPKDPNNHGTYSLIWEDDLEATCKDTGTKHQECSACLATIAGTEGTISQKNPSNHKNQATGADYGTKRVNIAAATCHSDGTYNLCCEGCDVVIDGPLTDTVTPRPAHNYGAWVAITAATCTSEGTERRTCQNTGCISFEENDIPTDPLNHGAYLTEWVEDIEATCHDEGTKHQICSGCRETIVGTEDTVSGINPDNHKNQATGADYGTKRVNIAAATCHSDGTYNLCCEGCDAFIDGPITDTVTPRPPHNYGTWVVITAATCASEGTERRTCQNTGCTEFAEQGIPIDPDNHVAQATGSPYPHEDVTDEVATCVDEGVKHQICSECRATIPGTENTVIPIDPTNHNNQATGAPYPTYQVEDEPVTCHSHRTYDLRCDGCDALLEANVIDDETPLVEHVWGDWEVDVEPTCADQGFKHRDCQNSGCSEQQDEDIPIDPNNHVNQATGDPYGTHEVTVDPVTCHSDRTYTSNCDGCNALISGPHTDTTTPRPDHVWGEWETTTEPTKTEEGEAKRTCRNTGCTEFETKVLEKLVDSLTDANGNELSGEDYNPEDTLTVDDLTDTLGNSDESTLGDIIGGVAPGKTLLGLLNVGLTDLNGNEKQLSTQNELRIPLTEDQLAKSGLGAVLLDAENNATILESKVEDGFLIITTGKLGRIVLIEDAPVAPQPPTSPKTGDHADVILLGLATVSVLACGLFAVTKKKENIR